LAGTGTIQPIYYYWPNTGTRRELSRQFDVIYNTLEYNSDKKEYTSKQETAVIEGNLFGKSIPAELLKPFSHSFPMSVMYTHTLSST